MTNFAKPVAQRPQQWLANLRTLATTSASGGTDYVVSYPQRGASDTRPESQRGTSMLIVGNTLAFDHEGNPTGLTGSGAASKKTGSWVKL